MSQAVPFIVLDVLLAAVVVALAFAYARRGKRLAEQESQLASLEAAKDRQIKDEVARRVAAEQKRLQREVEGRRAEVEKQAAEAAARLAEAADKRRALEERAVALDNRAEDLAERAGALDGRASDLDARERGIADAEGQLRRQLEETARLTTDEARQLLLARTEEELRLETARLTQKAANLARGAAEQAAREATIEAMSTLRGSVAGEGTITILTLPSDEMKGRIIGREGRNIRSLEHATGVDLLVDDTPRAIMLSSWDPLRRTVAARALRALVEDGRIHPARIEEVLEKTRQEIDEEAKERGEAAAFELGVTSLHERLVSMLGALSFITDHGQNLLVRAKECGLLAGAIGDELRIGGDALRRAGLLHEVVRGDKAPLLSPAPIASADLAQKFGEHPAVVAAIRALAQPADAPRTPYGVVLTTARRFVLARPGARDNNLQRHMDRLKEVEEIALARPGIERAVAVRAGRELRVHVRPEAVPDETTITLARDIARDIESKIDFPGQVRVLVIRETRAVSYAV